MLATSTSALDCMFSFYKIKELELNGSQPCLIVYPAFSLWLGIVLAFLFRLFQYSVG